MTAVRFADQRLVLPVAGRGRQVIVQGDLLKIFWNAFEGPQTAQALMQANRRLWADLAAARVASGLEDPAATDPIRLTSQDWEG